MKKLFLFAISICFSLIIQAQVNQANNEVVTDIDGNVYHTVTIGTQTWMVENLKTTKYNDGTAIPNTTDNSSWVGLTAGAYCWSNNDINTKSNYGALYNWYTVNTGKLAPTGWHVPSDVEWATLIDYLITNGYAYQGSGTDIAKSMASALGWNAYLTPGTIGAERTSNNSSGFTALPAGYRGFDGTFYRVGDGSGWWSSSEFIANYAWTRYVDYSGSDVARANYNEYFGFAVRCVKDDNTTSVVIPSLSTTVASSITSASASGGGIISNDGGATVTVRGVCWSTSQNPTIADSKSSDGTGVGTFTSNLTGLTENTTYYLRAYATNSAGTGYGNELSFRTNDVPDYIPTSGLVAWYPFNDNANDESGNGNNGKVNGATLTTDRFGNAISAYSFTTNQDITVPNSQNLNLYPLTISLWYNIDSLKTGENGNLFSKYVPAAWNGYQILVGDFSNVSNNGEILNDGFGVVPWYLRSGRDRIIGYYGEPPFLQRNISFNTWHHYVFVVDETGGKIYADGQLIDSHSWTGNPELCSNSFLWKIGGLYNNWYHGKIDDIGIWNRALTKEEITGLHNSNFVEKSDTVVDIEGNVYHTVTIGTQVWMVENLKTTKYNDGTAIPNTTNNSSWVGLTSGAYCWSNNDINTKSNYGALYNWYTVNTGKLAPTGWHVPSDVEWATLIDYLITNGYAYQGSGTDIAKSMASALGWNAYLTPGTIGAERTSNNSSGFTALPAGYRGFDGTFYRVGDGSGWWSSSEFIANYAWTRYVDYSGSDVARANYNEYFGFAVRCVKDDNITSIVIPSLNTTAASSTTTTSASSGGNISSDGGATVNIRGVCWSKSTNPTISDNKTVDGSGTGAFTSNITNLTAATTYHVRAYATNSAGTSYGEDLAFTTKSLNSAQHFTPIWTGNGFDHMNINIYSTEMDSIELAAGDEIGIFDGTNCVGVGILTGTITQTNTLNIAVSRNDGSENGYTDGNAITFKLFDKSENLEMTNVAATYSNTDPLWSTDGKFTIGATAFAELSGLTKVNQDITLNTGWNIISANVVPANLNLKDIFQSLIDAGKLKKVMDETGKTIENFGAFGGWKNNIGNLATTKGYKVNVTVASTLSLEGIPVALPLDINLAAGWNIISYPSASAQDAKVLVQSLIDSGKLKKVMDETGKSIENFGVLGGWKNNIGNFLPGKGYKVNVLENCILTIPADGIKSAVVVPELLASEHFKPVFRGNGTDHMNIHLVNLQASGLQAGDEIGIFDGESCVGSATISSEQMIAGSISIPASANDDLEMKTNGFTTGNRVKVKLYRDGQTFPLELTKLDGQDVFDKNASLLAQASKVELTGSLNFGEEVQFRCYPNPFSEQITIEIQSASTEKLEVNIYDINGKLVRKLYKGPAGKAEKLVWDGKSGNGARVVPGTYILIANEQIEKIVLKK